MITPIASPPSTGFSAPTGTKQWAPLEALHPCNSLSKRYITVIPLFRSSAQSVRSRNCYAPGMARGWESKAIESQQDDAGRKAPDGPALTPEERARHQQKAGLQLALAETQAQMGAACRPAHREMLKLRLDAIQAQLKDL